MSSRPNREHETDQRSSPLPADSDALFEGAVRLRAVWDMAVDAAITIDERGIIEAVNPAAQRIFGYTAAEMVSRNICMLMPSPDRERHDGYLREYLETGIAKIIGIGREVVGVRKDGTHFPIDIAVSELQVGGRRLFTGIVRDITSRKRAEEELRAERDFAESLIETAHAIVLVLDTEGRIVRFNPFLEDVSGYRLDEVRGQDWLTTFFPKSERERIREVFAQAVQDVAVRGNVHPIVTKSGVEREVAWWAKALKDAGGSVTGVLSIGHDITELRKAQRQLVQSERLAAIGQMVTGLAHESRNALQRAQACLDMLELEIGEDTGSELLDLTRRGREALDELHRLYEEVRNYATPVRLEYADCDLRELLRMVWNNLEEEWAAKGIRLFERAEGKNHRCRVDRHKIQQVLRNILENAIAVSPKGGRVRVTCADADIDGRAGVRISIHDEGPGLDDKQKKGIFEPFFTTKPKGTGLGMAIARQLVTAHGGTIAFGQSPRSGAEIIISLLKE